MAGQAVTGASDAPVVRGCSVQRSRLADRLADRFTPHLDARGIAQRVARAVLGVVLQTCS